MDGGDLSESVLTTGTGSARGEFQVPHRAPVKRQSPKHFFDEDTAKTAGKMNHSHSDKDAPFEHDYPDASQRLIRSERSFEQGYPPSYLSAFELARPPIDESSSETGFLSIEESSSETGYSPAYQSRSESGNPESCRSSFSSRTSLRRPDDEEHQPVGGHFRPLPERPLNLVCIGPNFRVGGVRQHALSLAKFLDRRRVRITEFLVTDPLTGELQSDCEMPAPVNVCDAAALDRVSTDCDVLLMWGAGFNNRLPSDRPLRVFLAHGETAWTRNSLEESASVVDHVIAVSGRVHSRVCQGFPTTTILNGVDSGRLGTTAERNILRRRFAFNPDDFVIGSVGRFTREKQFHLLIEAVERLPERFKLLLVGSGRRQAELLEHANQHIPGRFAFVSANDCLGDYYGAMDAFGMVSAHEGFGLVLAESMMCGRPVFATDVGCVPEVIRDRVNGLVVPPDADAIADVARLLQSHPLWARGMAEEGRAFANAHLHAARMAREYEDLLCRLVHDRKAGGGRIVP